ncbi:peptidase A4 family-domain-containing protein [Boletus edulis]|uniref:Peptidase A4 family-domain-containing protein n=1 Tax=Boletus edulis BED1 TaxID=1328754 RepID=A0AAD4BNK4_BOLED|nr:peptidase A4 family-domain-containing protein [Boletus edulis]KAF8435742.1 peptidase A4 family-domain-containing protein [Boletus edulis BED1]
MRFDFTFISTFLFASAVLADHSHDTCSSQILDVVEKRTSATSNSVKFVSTTAGAVLKATTPTFLTVTGSISVPFIWSKNNKSGVSIWVGIDGDPETHCNAVFAAGIVCTIDSDGPVYKAAAYWFSNNSSLIDFPNFDISHGDLVTVTVVVSDQNTGYATVQNLGNGTSKNITRTLNFTAQPPLCQLSAGWVVEKMPGRDLAHFGFVPILQPMAYGQGQEEFTAGGSSVYDMTTDDGLPLTVVEAYGDLIRITEKCV